MANCTPKKVENVGGRGRAYKRPVEVPEHVKDAKHAMEEALNDFPEKGPAPAKRLRKGRAAAKARSKSKIAAAEGEPENTEQEQDNEDGHASNEEEQTSKRKRTCRKKVSTSEEKKLDFVKKFLADLGVTWGRSQWFHNHHPVDDHASECKKNKGFVEMRNRLVEGKPPDCLTCFSVLEDSGFIFEKFEEELSNIENGIGESPFTKLKKKLQASEVAEPPLPPPSQPPPDDDGDMPDRDPTAGIIVPWTGQEEEGQEQKVNFEEKWELFRSMKCLRLLEPGSGGKILPAKCLACKSGTQPSGKVFELHKSRKEEIDFFTRQYLAYKHLAGVIRGGALRFRT